MSVDKKRKKREFNTTYIILQKNLDRDFQVFENICT